MLHHIKLYSIHNGRIDYANEKARRLLGSPVLNYQRPESIDIYLQYVEINYEGNEFSYARPYTIEKVFPAKKSQDGKTEEIERYAYRLSFNNPHDNETLYSPVICLSERQNRTFALYRFIRWLQVKDNILWLTNILVLIINIIALFLNK